MKILAEIWTRGNCVTLYGLEEMGGHNWLYEKTYITTLYGDMGEVSIRELRNRGKWVLDIKRGNILSIYVDLIQKGD